MSIIYSQWRSLCLINAQDKNGLFVILPIFFSFKSIAEFGNLIRINSFVYNIRVRCLFKKKLKYRDILHILFPTGWNGYSILSTGCILSLLNQVKCKMLSKIYKNPKFINIWTYMVRPMSYGHSWNHLKIALIFNFLVSRTPKTDFHSELHHISPFVIRNPNHILRDRTHAVTLYYIKFTANLYMLHNSLCNWAKKTFFQ